MNIQTGEITGTIAGGEIARTIEGYKMVRSTADDETNNKTAADASYRVSNLLFPLANITADANNKSENIMVVISIQRMNADGTEAVDPQSYALPFDVATHTAWEAGKNYTYTIKFINIVYPGQAESCLPLFFIFAARSAAQARRRSGTGAG